MNNVLQSLARRVLSAIPLTEHLYFEYRHFDGESLQLAAPLAPNSNDKGTFFAGSQSALLTLAGWSLTTLLAEARGGQVDVVAVESSLEYLRPLADDILIRVSLADQAELGRFHERLARKGRAPLRVLAQGVGPQGEIVCQYRGLYLARKLTDDS
ncbi:MAG: YiiD C-terminal domain-containing protein [Alcanivorax sp.]|nr:YiiD C-terminal domain-containing protein [Alcanivorax sp.]